MKKCLMLTILTFTFLSAQALNNDYFESQLDRFVDTIVQSDVILIGETHPNPLHSVFFIQVLENLERRHPEKLGVVGLETYTSYQNSINEYLNTGNMDILVSSKDDDLIRGHHQDFGIKRNLINIFQTLFFLNQRRQEPIRVVAMDHLPDPTMSLTEWKKSHSKIAFIRWAATRDPAMLERLRRPIDTAISKGQVSIIFVGNLHLQKHAETIGRIPIIGVTERTLWLGRRILEVYQNSISVVQSNNIDILDDVIEHDLRRQGADTIRFIKIADTSYKDILQKDFYIKTDIPKYIRMKYEPETSTVGDNYDYYVYFPRTLKYKFPAR